MSTYRNRRQFLRDLGLSAAALPFVTGLGGLARGAETPRKQRLVIMFSPNGVVPNTFWPDEDGAEFKLKESLSPLEKLRDRTLILHGVCDKVRGDGDNHMRGIGCLLTGIELFPGNIQGGSHTPAGWASGISIDQEIKDFLQQSEATRTRFGSLEFGVMVPDRADTWTRMCNAAGNKPIAPIDDPYQMFNKLYGRAKDRELLGSVLDDVTADLTRVAGSVGAADRRLLDEHATFVREMEQELRAARAAAGHDVPRLEPGVRKDNDRIPQISRMQIDLMVNAFKADFSRVATLQYTNSVGGARMKWLDINEGHHELSHEPDTNQTAVDKLTRINKWFAGELAYLARKLADTPEPGGSGNMLDNTVIMWTNELGKGNSHTLDNIPFLLVGGGLDFKTGRSLKFPRVAHNRLLMSLAHGFGHRVERFGSGEFCGAGALNLS